MAGSDRSRPAGRATRVAGRICILPAAGLQQLLRLSRHPGVFPGDAFTSPKISGHLRVRYRLARYAGLWEASNWSRI